MIRALLFDLDNVLIFIDRPRQLRQLADRLGAPVAEVEAFLETQTLEDLAARGLAHPEQFLQTLQAAFGSTLGIEDFLLADDGLFSINEPLLPILRALRRAGLRLVLTANVSPSLLRALQREKTLLSCFDVCVASYEIRSLFPESAALQAAVQAAGYTAQECLYIDDVLENRDAARSLGIDAEAFTEIRALVDALQRRGLAF